MSKQFQLVDDLLLSGFKAKAQALEDKNTEQDTELNQIKNKDQDQDTKITQIESNIANLPTGGGGGSSIRNVIHSGRVTREGYPCFLDHKRLLKIDQHGDFANGRIASFRASSFLSGHEPQKAFVNITNYKYPSGWATANTQITNQWIEISFDNNLYRGASGDFTTVPVITGVALWGCGLATRYPRRWQVIGGQYNNNGVFEESKVLLNVEDDGPTNPASGPNLNHAKFYELNNDELKAYSVLRFVFFENNGDPNYIQLQTIGLYEGRDGWFRCTYHNNYTNNWDNFKASIACGKSKSGDAIDYTVSTSGNVDLNPKLVPESRNYIYLVPPDQNNARPSYITEETSIEINGGPNKKAWLWVDPRPIVYDSLHDLDKHIFVFLYNRFGEATFGNVNNQVESNLAPRYPNPLYIVDVTCTLKGKDHTRPHGHFTFNAAHSRILPMGDLGSSNPNISGVHNHPSSDTFTVEMRVRFRNLGTHQKCVLFDFGTYTGAGMQLSYDRVVKCFYIYMGSTVSNGITYTVPYVFDEMWHDVVWSLHAGYMHIHVDRRIVGSWREVPKTGSYYNHWCLGNFNATHANSWGGDIAHVKVILDYCKYNRNSYPTANDLASDVVHGMLWWDNDEGVVKQCVYGDTFVPTPMLPLGSIDTKENKHLVSDYPHHAVLDVSHKCRTVKNVTATSTYDGAYVKERVLAYGNTGQHAYLTTTNNTIEHSLIIELNQINGKYPKFNRMRSYALVNIHWYSRLFRFILSGSTVGPDGPWITLLNYNTVDYNTPLEFGGGNMLGYNEITYPNGVNVPLLCGYRDYEFGSSESELELKALKLIIPPKNTIDKYKDSQYTGMLLSFFYSEDTPQVVNTNPAMIGTEYRFTRTDIERGTVHKLPVPCSNFQYEVTGHVREQPDWTGSVRPLGNSDYWVNPDGSGHNTGEKIYLNRDYFEMTVGATTVTPHLNTWGPSNVNAQAHRGVYHFIVKRRM